MTPQNLENKISRRKFVEQSLSATGALLLGLRGCTQEKKDIKEQEPVIVGKLLKQHVMKFYEKQESMHKHNNISQLENIFYKTLKNFDSDLTIRQTLGG